MLVVTRTAGEKILIGDDITVEIVRVNGGNVRVGVSAPPALHILRDELVGTQPKPKEAPHATDAIKS